MSSEQPLAGRVALVTGASRGVGREIALQLAGAGADVAVNYRKDRDAAEETVALIREAGRDADAFGGDVGVLDDCRSLAESVIGRFGSVGILVNNAGIASRGRSVAKTDPEELERVMRVHALGPHHLCQAVLPSMREQERGDIIFISSVATRSMAAGGGPYNMGKAAMEALASTLANEVVGQGIRVNVVAPGLVETEMGRRLMKALAGTDDMRAIDSTMPLGRVCTPADVASVVTFLCGPGAEYVTGQKIDVDGGA